MSRHTVILPRNRLAVDNAARAHMVWPLVQAFTDAYYPGGEVTDAVIGDLICDLLHCLSQCRSTELSDPNEDRDLLVRRIHQGALDNFDEEVEEEA